MTLTFTDFYRVMVRLEVDQLYEAAHMFVMVDYVSEMTEEVLKV